MTAMVSSHSDVFTFFSNPISRTTYGRRRTTFFVAFAIPTISQLNVRPTTRKNHLRPKILKTLIEPNPPITPLVPYESSIIPGSPISSSEAPQEVQELLPDDTPDNTLVKGEEFEELQVSESLGNSDNAHDSTVGKVEIFEELQVSESFENVGVPEGVTRKFSARSVLKYGAIFVGVFMLQTVVSVLAFSGADSEKKAGNWGRKKSGREILSKGNGKHLYVNLRSGENNMVSVSDLSEMEKKIEEIKVMAREARMIEEKKKKVENAGDSEMDDIDTESAHKIGIQKEISARLGKLEKKMNSAKDRLPRPNVNHLESSVTDNDIKNGNGLLMFKEKSELRSPSLKATKSIKGFQGIRNKKAYSTEMSALDKERVHLQVDGMEDNHHEAPLKSENSLNQESRALENNRKRPNLKAERRTEETKGNHVARQSIEVVHSHKSMMTGKQNSQGLRERNQETEVASLGDATLSMNGIPQHGPGMGQNMLSEDKVMPQKSNMETDFCWSSLPYVLVILIQRRREGSSGFYTVQSTNIQERDQVDLSYVVSFEDRVEADNLCFLLELAFQDLGGLSADIVPISIQELHDAIRLDGIKVVVVKKRQIQLYAGQPLAEVEEALRSLIRDQNASK